MAEHNPIYDFILNPGGGIYQGAGPQPNLDALRNSQTASNASTAASGGGLTTRTVTTVAIDPYSGTPVLPKNTSSDGRFVNTPVNDPVGITAQQMRDLGGTVSYGNAYYPDNTPVTVQLQPKTAAAATAQAASKGKSATSTPLLPQSPLTQPMDNGLFNLPMSKGMQQTLAVQDFVTNAVPGLAAIRFAQGAATLAKLKAVNEYNAKHPDAPILPSGEPARAASTPATAPATGPGSGAPGWNNPNITYNDYRYTPGESYTLSGQDMSFMPSSVQSSSRWQTGY